MTKANQTDPSKSGDEGWAERLWHSLRTISGEDVDARAESIILSYFASVRRDERRLAIMDAAQSMRIIAERM